MKKRHTSPKPYSERSKSLIEPRLSKQWYVSMESLAKPAADAARSGALKFYPDHFKKTYLHYLDNIEDWCISRQLWWGHRVPIFHCEDCKEVTCYIEGDKLEECPKCQSKNLQQDPDVLDTWFSSWLWPLSPFGWPSKDEKSKKELATFFPSDLLVTGGEIIFLWVARMIMAGTKVQG